MSIDSGRDSTSRDSHSHSSHPKSPSSSVNGTGIPSLRSSIKSSMTVERTASVMASAPGPPPQPQRPRKPRSFYPLKYGRQMRDMEIWDNMFFSRASGRQTLNPLEQLPPKPVMLDIGCGYGSWAIMTAQDLPDCQIVGFDMAEIQPNLKRLGLDDLAQRVTWVHGDMLQGLPFPDAHFDLVRTVLIEFCVPESKWGSLLEEIVRVLKPGGIFESSQEALIFPCPRFPPPRLPVHLKSRVIEDPKALAREELAHADPRDHSKLKAAFDAMLEVRFLNPKIVYTLPFYMQTHFDNVRMTPVIRVMLPPSSFVRGKDDTPSGDAAEPQFLLDQHISMADILQMDRHAAASEITVDQGGHMHLTQTLNIIMACKEAIWEQFEVLNPNLARDGFDILMRNWELDMRDRVDMRDTLTAGLGWRPPKHGEDPDRKAWRENLLKLYRTEGLWDAQPIPEACRAIRAFMGFKPRNGY